MPAGAILLAAALAVPVAAEPLPGCNDGRVHRMIVGWHDERKSWVEFYSQQDTSDADSFRFDRWTLLHCPTGAGVGVRGFAPFPYPSDDPSAPPRKISKADAAVFTAINGSVDGLELPAGRKGAAMVAERLEAAGVKATVGKGDPASCVCDPAWRQ